MMLSNTAISKAIAEGKIEINPYDPSCIGVNSYDVRLSQHIERVTDDVIRFDKPTNTEPVRYSGERIRLDPSELYLASTVEWTWCCDTLVPCITGKSSVGRLGISVHQTAGLGDAGFTGTFTLEISVVKPVYIKPFMPIAQLYWYRTEGRADPDYMERVDSHYTNQTDRPIVSQFYKTYPSDD
jgi:dCTP deaminase